MKSINKSLLVAAVLSTALSAMAQNPGGQNPGTGSTSPDPTNETNTTNASGARTENLGTGRTGSTSGTDSATSEGVTGSRTGMGADSGMNTNPNSVQDANGTSRTMGGTTDDMNQPKKKRSFWDRLFGRNKHLDSNQTDSSGRRIESQP